MVVIKGEMVEKEENVLEVLVCAGLWMVVLDDRAHTIYNNTFE